MQATKRGSWSKAALTAVPAAVAIAAVYCWYLSSYSSYAPFGDDPSIIAGSLGSPLSWFTNGFSQYFVVYPEWSGGTTDFFRPGVNLIVRLEHLLFGNQFWLYFALLYAAQLAVCLLVIDTLRMAGVPPATRSMFGVLAAVNPAFLGPALETVSYHFDIWCGLLSFLVFYLMIRNRYGLAFVCMCGAVFTKEAALYVPVAACITAYLTTRRTALAASMLVPLAGWILVRKFVFVGSLAHVYAVQPSFLGALKIFKGAAIWPVGVLDPRVVRQIVDQHSIQSHLVDVTLMVANAVLWIVLITGAVRVMKRSPPVTANARSPDLLWISLLWLAGALAFGVLVGQEGRFGGSIFPLEIVFVGLLTRQSAIPRLRVPGWSATAILSLAFAWNANLVLREQNTQPVAMQKLLAVIKHQAAPVVYVVSAPLDWTSTPESVAAITNPSARVVILSQFEGCVAGPGGATTIGRSSPSLSIEVQYPACAHLTMGSVPPRILAGGVNGTVTRGGFASYQFSEGQVLSNAMAVGAEPTVTLGTRLQLSLDPGPPGGYVLLYYDWSTGSYLTAG
jgi:hypothetical protein